MADQNIDRLIDFGEPAALDGMPQENLVAIIVPGRIEFERALAHQLRLQLGFELWIFRLQVDADAGQDARQRLDICLRIAGAYAHGVQFHDLAGVVLVQMARRIIRIVEITQHRRMIQRGGKKIAEFAKRKRTDRAILVVADQDADIRLVLMHVEMVEPEPCHTLAQLIGRIERAQDAARGRLLAAIVHRLLVHLLRGLLLVGIGDLIGRFALLLESDRDIEREFMGIRHRLDLRLGRRGQGVIRRRMQLLGQPALNADRLQMRRARTIDAPCQPVQQHHVMRRKLGGVGHGATQDSSAQNYSAQNYSAQEPTDQDSIKHDQHGISYRADRPGAPELVRKA